jgi:hypothetical protein
MKLILLFILLILSPVESWAQRDICDVLKIPNCPTVMRQSRRSSFQSLPSPGTAANLNPANVSFDRGLGVELIYQPNNSLDYTLVTGTGKFGGALISSSVENGFFGNRNIETDYRFMQRNEDKEQYRSKKLNLALGGRALGRGNYTLDVGLLIKRHNEIKDINLGLGVSARLGFLTLGASIYQDDFLIKAKDAVAYNSGMAYDAVFLGPTYQESFQVQTFSAGIRYQNFSIDTGFLKTRYKLYQEDSVVQLIATAFAYKNLIFNLARRVEMSPQVKFIEEKLNYNEKEVTNYYTGIQVSMGKHLVLGTAYNYFLLREVSVSATIFF